MATKSDKFEPSPLITMRFSLNSEKDVFKLLLSYNSTSPDTKLSEDDRKDLELAQAKSMATRHLKRIKEDEKIRKHCELSDDQRGIWISGLGFDKDSVREEKENKKYSISVSNDEDLLKLQHALRLPVKVFGEENRPRVEIESEIDHKTQWKPIMEVPFKRTLNSNWGPLRGWTELKRWVKKPQ